MSSEPSTYLGSYYFHSGAGLIACKDVGRFAAFSCPWPPTSTFYKLLAVTRWLKGGENL